MSLSNLNRLPIELITFDTPVLLAFVILGLFTQVLLYIFLDLDNKIYSFLLVRSKPCVVVKEEKDQSPGSKEKKQDKSFCIWRDEVETILKRLGLFSKTVCQDGGIEEKLDQSDLWVLFEEKEETSLDEMKAAFDVYDENRDGFIDAEELQRLLCALGLKEGLELQNCRKMIMAADQDGDERIDFNEFLQFMGN